MSACTSVFSGENESRPRAIRGEIEQIVDDARLEFDAAPQHSHIGAQRGRNFLARFPKIQRGQDRRKGSAQLVGEHGEKLVFCLVSGLGRVFGREHFLLGPLLLGEIAENEHDAANTALAVPDGSAAVVDWNFAPVFPNQQGVIRQTDDHAFPDHLIDRALHRRASVLVQDPKDFRRRSPNTSLDLQPVTSSATGFINVIRPPLSVTRTQSPMLESVTLSNSFCRCNSKLRALAL